ncbi:hypothetical protein XELAEV_18002787mg [Xenopus laevis]|nr:hypothetical protein XELAEV_18002787mg [Xenopus laevis]
MPKTVPWSAAPTLLTCRSEKPLHLDIVYIAKQRLADGIKHRTPVLGGSNDNGCAEMLLFLVESAVVPSACTNVSTSDMGSCTGARIISAVPFMGAELLLRILFVGLGYSVAIMLYCFTTPLLIGVQAVTSNVVSYLNKYRYKKY